MTFAMIYAFVFPVVITLILNAKHLPIVAPKTSSDWAAWIQAIGSIAAIVAATVIAGGEAERDRKKNENQQVQRAELVWHLSALMLDAVQHAIEVLLGRRPSFDLKNFDTAMAALADLSLSELPTSSLAVQVLSLRRGAEAFVTAYALALAISQRGLNGQPEDDTPPGEDPEAYQARRFHEIAQRAIVVANSIRDTYSEIHREVRPGTPVEIPISSDVV